MLEVFFDVYDELASVINKNLVESLAAIDKDLLEELCIFLQLFDQAINQLSDEDKPTIHQVIPIRQLLINHCEVALDDSDGLKEVKNFVGKRILKNIDSMMNFKVQDALFGIKVRVVIVKTFILKRF